MDEAWERAVEAALEGQATPTLELRVLNLDGAVKSLHGCLPPAGLLERFPSLEHLSIANVGAPSLDKFPRLSNLRRLILSDNRIAGGLDSLVDAGLQSLRDLDLSNNRIQRVEDLAPLAALHLVSLDLYECPVTRINDYRSKVFSMIRTLKYLDKLDANENERPETDDEEEEEDDYDDEEEDPGNGEVDGGDQTGKLTTAAGKSADGDEGIVDADEDEESDADEEEMETGGRGTGSGSSGGSGHHLSNGFRVAATGAASVEGYEHDGDDVEDEDDDEDDDLGEEIDEEEADDEDDAVEIHDVLDSDEDDEDGVDEVEDDEEEIDEEDGDDVDEEVDDDEMGVGDEEGAEPVSTGRLASAEGEIDGHDHGEEDENGEIGEEDEQVVEDRDAEEEDYGESEDEDDLDGEYLVQPIARSSWPDSSVGNEEEDEIDQEDENNRPSNGNLNQASSSSDANKRKRDEEGQPDDDKTEELRQSKRR